MRIKNKIFKKIAVKNVHFVGIGGIGISALAQWYLSEGWEVSGSDLAKSDIIKMLKKCGAIIFNFPAFSKESIFPPAGGLANGLTITEFSKRKEKIKQYIKKVDRVIYSSAVPESDWELRYAKKIGKKILSYPEALGELTKKYKTICVSGTHGKSTTTAMLALIMIKAGMDPTVILGTKMKELNELNEARPHSILNEVGPRSYTGNNFRKGKSEWLLIEADEYKAAFLNYSPQMIVLNNIDKDHMDYYKDMGHIVGTYKDYIKKLPRNGTLIFNGDDKNIRKIFTK
ncbi:MAG: hypothetical protein US76_01990 [Parcubacteria group bacterium GW2011_GWA2_38_13b]|nr:MAG: hypothetical protein US76_01990 [Parcubacteria group bacterium GW2011_GWA2_38_13b]